MFFLCHFVMEDYFAATMVTAVFADCIEKKHGVNESADSRKRELQKQRPKIQQIETTAKYIYFLPPDSVNGSQRSRYNNEIELFYLLYHTVTKKTYIPGIDEE
jgi:hypothetical protein